MNGAPRTAASENGRVEEGKAKRSLSAFSGHGYSKGRPVLVQVLWLLVSSTVLFRWWFPNVIRLSVLRGFGAELGEGVLIRHNVKIHWPWKLSVGNNTWIGEGAWILNLEPVVIGSDVCVSQSALLCTGSHDRHSPSFEFDNAPIVIGDGVWLAARSTVLRGVTVGAGSTVGACSLVVRDVPPGSLFVGRGDGHS